MFHAVRKIRELVEKNGGSAYRGIALYGQRPLKATATDAKIAETKCTAKIEVLGQTPAILLGVIQYSAANKSD